MYKYTPVNQLTIQYPNHTQHYGVSSPDIDAYKVGQGVYIVSTKEHPSVGDGNVLTGKSM